MNVAMKIAQFDPQCVWFRDVKKNMIIDGKFTKLIYTHEWMTLVGVVLLIPIFVESIEINMGKIYIHYVCDNLEAIEHDILDTYQRLFNCNYKLKKCKFQTAAAHGLDKRKMLAFPLASNWGARTEKWKEKHNYHLHLKIIGVWETDSEVGITYKYVF